MTTVQLNSKQISAINNFMGDFEVVNALAVETVKKSFIYCVAVQMKV